MRSKRSFFHPNHPRKRGMPPEMLRISEACAWSPPFGGDHAGALSLDTDKSQFGGGRFVNRPYGFGGDLSQHTDKSQFEGLSKHSVIISLKDKWAHKRNAHRKRSLPSANTGRAPSGMGDPCSHPLHWATKKPFPKRFLRSFFLKKTTLRAAAPSAPQRPALVKCCARRRTAKSQLKEENYAFFDLSACQARK